MLALGNNHICLGGWPIVGRFFGSLKISVKKKNDLKKMLYMFFCIETSVSKCVVCMF